MKTKTQTKRDGYGRTWEVKVVPTAEAREVDLDFWMSLTPEARVEAVYAATESALKAQGKLGVPRLRRVARRVERSWR